MLSTETIYIESLRGNKCSKSIRAALLKLTGVHDVKVYDTSSKICVVGIGLNRFLLSEKLAAMGYPERGGNTLFKKAKSVVSCLLGR